MLVSPLPPTAQGRRSRGRAHTSLVDFYIYTLQAPGDGRVRNYNLTSLASRAKQTAPPLGHVCLEYLVHLFWTRPLTPFVSVCLTSPTSMP